MRYTENVKIVAESKKKVDKAFRDYFKRIEKSSQIKVPAKELSYDAFFQNKMLIIYAIRAGFSYHLFSLIKEITPFSESDWAEYLNLSIKTLQRHKQEENYHFKPIHTEKIIELAEVTKFGEVVFDSLEQFYAWLSTPSYALGNLKPSELLKDSYGKELVMAELNRIEHGIFA
ncbi:MAG: DUF2384 domain-containing protein [Flavobacteriales bacterium]|nr:DUF2384 domain-containing protein [Flavobacteriales bacterium]